MDRRTESAEERAERDHIEKSLKTSTYLTDQFWESIHKGVRPVTAQVPNYGQPSRGTYASEADGIHMDLDGFYKTAAVNMTDVKFGQALGDAHTPREGDEATFPGAPNQAPLQPQTHSNQPRLKLSRNQAMAIKKYPTLIEFLGRPEGDKIAKEINGHMNSAMCDLIQNNSKEANEHAIACKADKQNLKQYFQGEGWVCRVTASGPFRGDELIYYSRDKDIACVLRKSEHNGQVKYADISTDFNIIYEAELGEIPPALVEETKVEDSVEQTTSTEEQGEQDEDEVKSEVMGSTSIEEVNLQA